MPSIPIKEAFENLDTRLTKISLPDFSELNVDGSLKQFPIADLLLFQKRQQAPIQIILAGHQGTVYPRNLNLNKEKMLWLDENRLQAPVHLI